jgi:hypothetical protein
MTGQERLAAFLRERRESGEQRAELEAQAARIEAARPGSAVAAHLRAVASGTPKAKYRCGTCDGRGARHSGDLCPECDR